MSAKISKVTIIGSNYDFNKAVDSWAFHQNGKSLLGLDSEERIVVVAPRELCVIEYHYGAEHELNET